MKCGERYIGHCINQSSFAFHYVIKRVVSIISAIIGSINAFFLSSFAVFFTYIFCLLGPQVQAASPNRQPSSIFCLLFFCLIFFFLITLSIYCVDYGVRFSKFLFVILLNCKIAYFHVCVYFSYFSFTRSYSVVCWHSIGAGSLTLPKWLPTASAAKNVGWLQPTHCTRTYTSGLRTPLI